MHIKIILIFYNFVLLSTVFSFYLQFIQFKHLLITPIILYVKYFYSETPINQILSNKQFLFIWKWDLGFSWILFVYANKRESDLASKFIYRLNNQCYYDLIVNLLIIK